MSKRKQKKPTTLPKVTVQLLEEICTQAEDIFSRKSEENRKRILENPDAYLVSLLRVIKENLPRGSAMLRSTVQKGTYESYLEEAQKALAEELVKT